MIVTEIKDNSFIISADYEERYSAQNLGARWSSSLKKWKLAATLLNYNRLTDAQASVNSDITQIFNEMESKYVFHTTVGFKSKTEAYKHQEELTKLVLSRKQCFFLCAMGTGKSKAAIDAIGSLYYSNKIKKVLVVSPASIMLNFKDEIEKHSDLESVIIGGSIKKRIELLEVAVPVHIINYEMLKKLKLYLIHNKYDMIVFDECHKLKGRTTQQSKAAYEISKEIEYRVGMTGSLIANTYEDCYMPYKIIAPKVFGAIFKHFQERYLIYGGFENRQVVGYHHKEEFKKALKVNSLKYSLDDVVDLPPEVNIIKKFELSSYSRKVYDELKKNFFTEGIDVTNALTRILRLSQITSGILGDEVISHGKIDLLKECIEGIEGKVIVWCRFINSIHRVAALCDSLGLSYYTYYGATKDKGIYKKYNVDNTKVWIAQIQTGIGYSIPSASYAIFYESDYSRVNHIQSRGRNRRLTGSESKSCIYTYLHGKDTIDEAVYQALKEKDFTAEEAMSLIMS